MVYNCIRKSWLTGLSLDCKFSIVRCCKFESYLFQFFRMIFDSYFNILVFLLLSSLLSSIIFVLSFVLSSKADDIEKISAYECGFNPFEDSRNEFDIRFYVVAILFLIFDLEISFLFPFAVSFDTVGLTGLASMLIFLFILTLGFVYEWKKGALDWD